MPEAAESHDARAIGNLYGECCRLAASAQTEQACACYRQLLARDPAHARAHNNLGVLLQRRGELAAAERSYREAMQHDPMLAEPHVNLGNLHDIGGATEAAVLCYRRALEIDPRYARAHCALAQALLALGDFREGWEEYEWRWQDESRAAPVPRFTAPLWDGSQKLAGRRVLLHAEQGYGDAMQFIRYAPLLAERGAVVLAICDPALERLFRTVPDVEAVVEAGQPLPEFDYQVPLMSLPRGFGTTLDTIPQRVPYFRPDDSAVKKWRARLGDGNARLKVGLAWTGRPTHAGAAVRSCPLPAIAPLLDAPGCEFVSLQKGDAAAALHAAGWSPHPVADYTAELGDFFDTAALVAALDVVVSVDTAIAHLAGALGKPLWLLLPAVPEWRWLPPGAAQKWYPTARLFRQEAEGDWPGVIGRVRRALAELPAEGAGLT